MKKLLIYLADSKIITIILVILLFLGDMFIPSLDFLLPINNKYYGFFYIIVGLILLIFVGSKIHKLYCSRIDKEKYNILSFIIVLINILILFIGSLALINGVMSFILWVN